MMKTKHLKRLMELLYYRDSIGNFGDDLNELMWKMLLPSKVFDVPDTMLMGIGSIFNAERAPLTITQGKRMFVLGSGAGYGPLPPGWETWTILAVRGPLTAALIGRPELAVTDSAALLSILPALVKMVPNPDLSLFIPHHHSMNYGLWAEAAAKAGLTFVDPRWKLEKVMDYFSRAKLVVTEAMHGAIVADTLRIPWIPIMAAPDALPFKWRDWTLSLDLPYEPVRIPASSFQEASHHKNLARRSEAAGLIASGRVKEVDSPASLVEDFKVRYRDWVPPVKKHEDRPADNAVKAAFKAARRTLDPIRVGIAGRAIKSAAEGRQHLSAKAVLDRKVEVLQETVEQLIQTICN